MRDADAVFAGCRGCFEVSRAAERKVLDSAGGFCVRGGFVRGARERAGEGCRYFSVFGLLLLKRSLSLVKSRLKTTPPPCVVSVDLVK